MTLSEKTLEELNIGEALELSTEILQELKDGKISVSDLNERYFIGYKHFSGSYADGTPYSRWLMSPEESEEVVRKNIEVLLYGNLCTFKDLVEKLHDIPYRVYDEYNTERSKTDIYNNCLLNFLKNDDLLVDLNKNEKLMGPEMLMIWNTLATCETSQPEFHAFCKSGVLDALILADLVSFQDVIDTFLDVN